MSIRFPRTLRFVAAMGFTVLATNASANCAITHFSAFPEVSKALKDNGGYNFKNYDVVCNKLQRANANIVISATNGVLANRSYAWASINVADKADRFFIIDSHGSTNTWLHEYASSDKSQELLFDAINSALNDWEGLDLALEELQKARKSR